MFNKLERYILQQHNSKTAGLHYELHISFPNHDLLASFAIPKAKIPKIPGDKVLCVKTSDHGRIWLNIENMTIPDGEYGAGEISTISKGVCDIYGWSSNHITLIVPDDVNNEYFNGRYDLIKFKGDRFENLWILVKRENSFIRKLLCQLKMYYKCQ